MSRENWVDGDGWISDESSFIGGEDEVDHLEESHQHFNSALYWRTHQQLINTTVASKMTENARPESEEPEELFNLYEGKPCAWQLGEDISGFMSRLPPVTTTTEEVGPWIWIMNPRRKYAGKTGDIAGLKEEGEELMGEFLNKKTGMERQNEGKPKGVVTRKMNPMREQLKSDIDELAKEKQVVHGKWMFFPSVALLPEFWSCICKGVIDNRLGTSAKVATNNGGPESKVRLICVYTKDYSDLDDVYRVLKELVKMNLVSENDTRGIYYKSDAYTWLDISSGNPYGLRASLYSSKDMLASRPPPTSSAKGDNADAGARQSTLSFPERRGFASNGDRF